MTDIKPDTIPVTDLPDASPSDPLEALSWLGDTVEEIAEGLRARGIKGRMMRPDACPLHNYLALWGWDYAVAGSMIRNKKINNSHSHWQPAPDILRSFVSDFDHGYLPDLIDNG